MDQTSNVTPAQSAPSTPSTTQASKTQAKSGSEPANEADFKKELLAKIHEAQGTPALLLVPKMAMQGSIDAKLRVATRLLLQKVEWLDEDGTTKCEAGARPFTARMADQGVPCGDATFFGVYWHFSHRYAQTGPPSRLVSQSQCGGLDCG